MHEHELNDLKKWVEAVDKKLDNHLLSVGKDIAKIQTDLDWVKKFFWLVASVSITAIVAAVFGLILKT